MFHSRKTVLYFAPHQDDELLSMGIDICTSLKKKDEVHVILCSDGSKSYVKRLLGNGKTCKKHEGTHCYPLSTEEFVAARDREFRASCRALGVEEKNIHIPEKRAIDGSMEVDFAQKLIRGYVEELSPDLICTIAPDNGPSQHRDHKALGRAVVNLVKSGAVRKARLFVEPYHYAQIAENPRLIPVAPTVQTATKEIAEKIKNAIAAYSLWEPSKERYAVGYHSVTTEFVDFLNSMKTYSYERLHPQSASRVDLLREQHRKWKKLRDQKQFYYSMAACDAPELGDLKLIDIQSGELEGYREFCEKHGCTVTEKNLQRLRDGSSFWCLVSPEGVAVTEGWLAWKQDFYISETDYAFSTWESDVAVLYNFNTLPEYRGKGLYGQLLRSIVCKAQGPKRYIIYTAPDNHSSDRGIRKAGFQFDGALSAGDGSLPRYFRNHGFTSIRRKYRLWGLRVES